MTLSHSPVTHLMQVRVQLKLLSLMSTSLRVYHDPCSFMHHISSEHGPGHQTSAPLKYSIPHAVVSFGPAGQLIRVTPGLSTQENVSQLEIHSLEVGSALAWGDKTVTLKFLVFSNQSCFLE